MKYKIAQLAKIIDGDRGVNYPKQNEFQDEGYCLFLDAGNVTINGFSFNSNQFISERKHHMLHKGVLEYDDIVYTTRGTIGNVAYYGDKTPYPHVRINSGMVILRTKQDVVNPLFLYHLLRHKNYRAYVTQYSTGSAQPQLPIKALSKIKLDIPPLAMQNKIASILSAYDDLIENNQKRIKLLEKMAQRLYQEWFVRFRFPGYEKAKFVDGIPQGWEYGRLSEVISLLDSKRIPLSSMERDRMERNYPYYGAAGQLGFVEDFIFDGTYLLLGEDGSVITEDGYPYLQYVWGKFWVNNHAHIIEQRGNYSVEFLYCMFKKMNVQSIVTGVAQPKISQGRLFMKKVLLPSDIVLKAFNEKIQPLFSQIKVLTEQNKKLTKQRDLLLPRLMSGKLAV